MIERRKKVVEGSGTLYCVVLCLCFIYLVSYLFERTFFLISVTNRFITARYLSNNNQIPTMYVLYGCYHGLHSFFTPSDHLDKIDVFSL